MPPHAESGIITRVPTFQKQNADGYYSIPAESIVAKDGKSGRGIVSHAQVDKNCKWADGVYAGSGKEDVDAAYLNRVLKAVKHPQN